MRVFCLALTLSFIFCKSAFAQKEFFQSELDFTPDNLSTFYSTVTVTDNTIFFVANDYRLYAYDRVSGKQKWNTKVNYKTNIPLAVTDEAVYAGFYHDHSTKAAVFDIKTGKLIRELPFGNLETKPFFKDGIMYATAIYEGGCVFAYDLKKDTVLWWRFLAHGVSNQPYYFKNYIHANAEGTNWVKLNYEGKLIDTTCKEKAEIFVSDIPCIQNFIGLTHDGEEINGKLAEKILGDRDYIIPEVITSLKNTFILFENKLTILGNKRKIRLQVDVLSLSDRLSNTFEKSGRILKADDEKVVFIYDNHILYYNHKTSKLERMIDFSQWEPHQVVLENEKAWVISRKDGKLYGIQL